MSYPHCDKSHHFSLKSQLHEDDLVYQAAKVKEPSVIGREPLTSPRPQPQPQPRPQCISGYFCFSGMLALKCPSHSPLPVQLAPPAGGVGHCFFGATKRNLLIHSARFCTDIYWFLLCARNTELGWRPRVTGTYNLAARQTFKQAIMQDRRIVKGERSKGALPEEGCPYSANLSPDALSCYIGVLPPERPRGPSTESPQIPPGAQDP